MAYIHRLIIFLLLISFNVFAASVPAVVKYHYYFNTGLFTSNSAACSAQNGVTNPSDSSSTITSIAFDGESCTVHYNWGGSSVWNPVISYFCSTGTLDNSSTPPSCLVPDIPPPPVCVAGEGPSGYLATGSCLNGCRHIWSGQQAKIGDTTYGMYLGKTGSSCTTTDGNPLMNKGDVDAAMQAADDVAAAAAASAKAAAAAKSASDKAAASDAAAAAKAASDKAASDKAAADKAAADSAAADKAAADAAAKAAADAVNSTKTDAEKAASSGAAGSAAAAAAAKAADAAAKAATAASAAADAAAKAGASAGANLPDSPPEFCSLHPSSIICKNSSINAGSCSGHLASSFSCSGDAIQCQIAKQQVDEFCANIADDDTSKLGAKVLDGTADLGGLDTFSTPHEVGIGSIDETSWLPKGCLPDMTFVIVGQTIVLPLSRLCEGLQTAGKIVKAFAFMIAAKIIFS